MEFRVLGPLEVVGRDEQVAIRGIKRRALLAYLLVHEGGPVALDRLVHDLWDERPTRGARGTVQTYLSQLRKLLASDEQVRLETDPAGYVLDFPPDRLDSRRFEALCAGAASEATPAVRLLILDEALALWRGRPLSEFAGSAWADAEATRLATMHLEALRQRIDALLELGGHAETIAELERLVGEHPLDERFWAQLMLAYYGGGRQADALRAYQRARTALVDELGIEPGNELVTLERQILDHDPALMATSPPMQPPVPARLAPGTAFFGREEERVRFGAALDAVRSAPGRRVLLVSGEPGIGKTSLLARCAQTAHAEGLLVLYGHCDDGLRIPYQPWREALGQLVRHAPDAVLAASAGGSATEIARLLPSLAGLGQAPSMSPDPEGERYRLFSGVVDVFARATSAAPLLLALDDLHWADAPSLQLLRYLVGMEAPLKLVVVATYRDTDIDERHELLATLVALDREPGVERLSLDGLPGDAVGALLEAAVGHQLDANGLALRDVLLSETDGNPFFVTEVIRHLVETGVLGPSEQDGSLPIPEAAPVGLPTTVREVITQRAARLGDEARRLLVTASVIGQDFEVGLLTDVTGAGETVVLDSLDAATSAALVRPLAGEADRYGFVHALIAHALTATLSPTRRRRIHGRVAEQLERRVGDKFDDQLAELARHWLEAGGNPDKAVDYASRAGARAVAQLAPDDGLHWYRQALDGLDRTAGRDDPRRAAVLTGLGDAQRQTGDPGHRETLLAAADLARRLGDSELLARAVVANNRGMLNAVGVADAERLEALEAAERATEGATTPTRALVLATLAAELAFVDRVRMLRVARAAIELARRLGDDHALVTVLTRLAAAISSPDTLVERTALADEAVAVAERTGDPVLRWYGAAMGYTAALEAGDIAAFRQRVEVVDELARGIGQPFMRWVSAIARSVREHLAGNLDRAEAPAAEGLDIGSTSGQADALVFYSGAIVGIRFDQGRLGELVGLVEGASSDNGIPGTRAVLALCYCEVGRKAEAGALLEGDASDDFSGVSFDPMWTSFMSLYTRVADQLADQRAANRLARLLEPWCDQIAMSGAGVWGGSLWSSVALAQSTAGRHDAAERSFARAAAVHERIEAPLLLARTHADWAGLLLPREPGQSRALARSARATAAGLGAWSIERHAGELLDQLDTTPAR